MAARELRCRRGHGNADGGARHVSHVAAYTDEDEHSRASGAARLLAWQLVMECGGRTAQPQQPARAWHGTGHGASLRGG